MGDKLKTSKQLLDHHFNTKPIPVSIPSNRCYYSVLLPFLFGTTESESEGVQVCSVCQHPYFDFYALLISSSDPLDRKLWYPEDGHSHSIYQPFQPSKY